MLRAGVAQCQITLDIVGGGIVEPENSLLPEYPRSDWALTCAWLFASTLSKVRRAQAMRIRRPSFNNINRTPLVVKHEN